MAANRKIDGHIFYDNVTTTDESDTCIFSINSDVSTIMLDFKSTGTFSVKLYGSIFDKENDSFKPYMCFKFPTLDMIDTEITDDSYLYQVDVTAIDYFKVVITAITGSLAVRGRVVGWLYGRYYSKRYEYNKC